MVGRSLNSVITTYSGIFLQEEWRISDGELNIFSTKVINALFKTVCAECKYPVQFWLKHNVLHHHVMIEQERKKKKDRLGLINTKIYGMTTVNRLQIRLIFPAKYQKLYLVTVRPIVYFVLYLIGRDIQQYAYMF